MSRLRLHASIALSVVVLLGLASRPAVALETFRAHTIGHRGVAKH